MRKLLIIIIILALIHIWLKTAEANSVTYRISVTIPAIAGVNVPAINEEDISSINQSLDIQTEEVLRNNQKVLLHTVVPK